MSPFKFSYAVDRRFERSVHFPGTRDPSLAQHNNHLGLAGVRLKAHLAPPMPTVTELGRLHGRSRDKLIAVRHFIGFLGQLAQGR